MRPILNNTPPLRSFIFVRAADLTSNVGVRTQRENRIGGVRDATVSSGDVVTNLHAYMDKKKLTIIKSLPLRGPPCLATQPATERAYQSAVNAKDAMPNGGDLTFATEVVGP